MKIFHCDHCQHLVFFENVSCVRCKHSLAYLPDIADLVSLEAAGAGLWRSPARGAAGLVFRLCENYSKENICNWVVAADDANPLCRSCRLTSVVPDMTPPGNREVWYRIEVAKRRLIYSLLALNLPLLSKTDDPEQGLAFEFRADSGQEGSSPVITGHQQGTITLNIAEADDAERERRRLQMHEPYRTLLGHFRHEIAHYYWDRLIRDSHRIDAFRQHFGNEQEDYGVALKHYYDDGAPPDWQTRFVSAYASSHPWEDWAETWAHYLHLIDTLETAVACGLSLRPRRADEPKLTPDLRLDGSLAESFDQMMERWFPLTFVLNNLNRGLGLRDAYPFVLSPPAIDKLRFIHEVIAKAASTFPPTTVRSTDAAVGGRNHEISR